MHQRTDRDKQAYEYYKGQGPTQFLHGGMVYVKQDYTITRYMRTFWLGDSEGHQLYARRLLKHMMWTMDIQNPIQ